MKFLKKNHFWFTKAITDPSQAQQGEPLHPGEKGLFPHLVRMTWIFLWVPGDLLTTHMHPGF